MGGIAVVAVAVLAACSSSGTSSSSTTTAAGGSSSTAAGASSSSAPAATGLMKAGVLTVGMNLQFKPEMYLDNGKPAGYDVDLLKALAKSMKLKLNIQNLDFNGLIPGLQANKFDMVSVGLSPTAARKKVVGFSRAYVPYAQVLGVPAKQATSITATSQLDVKGKTVTALQGSTDQQLAQQVFKNATITGFPDQNAAFLQVATGRANGVVAEDYLLAQYSKSNPGQLAQAKLAKPLNVQYGSWATPQSSTAFISYLNKWLCQEQTSGKLAKLYEKDFGTKAMPKMPACSS
jgi:ABC-type amino acid transport substrate-binding protein